MKMTISSTSLLGEPNSRSKLLESSWTAEDVTLAAQQGWGYNGGNVFPLYTKAGIKIWNHVDDVYKHILAHPEDPTCRKVLRRLPWTPAHNLEALKDGWWLAYDTIVGIETEEVKRRIEKGNVLLELAVREIAKIKLGAKKG